ncbi:hypothetical protein [Mesorhizobium sp. 113-3-3]|uniref:hypothetical protein n=1 Tax=Mesorhizobium sp. 113-3-3 TaxID=2744516 RepID=UPI0018EC4269|nr:hypothetical protein [Mesorhizobium sp. 113-3-3]BCG83369.1 hypothetical protein MesoLj113b_69110 [Mesorhizobium sp. 113-3-3]
MKTKIWIVSTCTPERGEGPCLPEAFGTEEAADARLEEAMRDEWQIAGIFDEEGTGELPYPGDWREAQRRLHSFHEDGSWGTWQITAHLVDIGDPVPDHASDTVDALVQAESFIRGFEDDELQEGIADILAGLRAAIPREQARPDMLAALHAVMRCAKGELERPVTQRAPWGEAQRLVEAAIAKAEAAGTEASAPAMPDHASDLLTALVELDSVVSETPPNGTAADYHEWTNAQASRLELAWRKARAAIAKAERQGPAVRVSDLLAVLKLAVTDWPQFDAPPALRQPGCQPDGETDVNGGDLVEWFGNWRRAFVLPAIAKAEGRANG